MVGGHENRMFCARSNDSGGTQIREITMAFQTCFLLALVACASALTADEQAARQAAKDLLAKLDATEAKERRASSAGPTVSAVGGSLKLSTANDVQISVAGEEVVTFSSGAAAEGDSLTTFVQQTIGGAKLTVSWARTHSRFCCARG
jgi:hypothetical protein